MCMSRLPQERDDEELLALAAMSDDESAGEAGPANGGNANATDDAANGTATTAPLSAAAGAAADKAAQAAEAHQCTPTMFGSQDGAQVSDVRCPTCVSWAAATASCDTHHSMLSPVASLQASQGLGMADRSAVTAGAPAEDATVGSAAPDPVTDSVELAPQCDSLVPPDVDLADVDDEELLQMALA